MEKSLVQLTSEAKELHNLALSIIDAIGRRSYELAKVLYEIKKKKLYKYVFGDETWSDYVASLPNMSLSTADKLIKRYEVYILKLGYKIDQIAKINIRSLNVILPIAERSDKSVADEWIEKAKHLTSQDIVKEYVQYTRHIDPRQCEHDFAYFVWCKKCKENFSSAFAIQKRGGI